MRRLSVGTWPSLGLLLILAVAADASAQSRWNDALEAFSAAIAADVESDGIGGIAAGVMVDGDLVWSRAYGLANRVEGETMGTASISRTGSISKSVTALLMMRLVEQGVLGLDDPVHDYLPEIGHIRDRRPGARAMTFRDLASHTAGIVREPDLEGAATGPIEAWEDKVLASLKATRFDSIPGARYQYSNIGFGTLGLALSRAAGRPFIDMVQEEVFAPLGMTGSTFVIGDLEPRLAVGYANRRDGSVDAEQPALEHAGRGYKVPNGGVYSTVADLGRFMGAMCGVPGLDILSEEGRLEMLRVQTPESPSRGYGLGFSLRTDGEGRTIASHGGSVAGYTAHLAFDPDARIGVVLLRNYQRGATVLGQATQGLVQTLRALSRD
jgi:CubicO group peptidase (beta-lactamase class C family)